MTWLGAGWATPVTSKWWALIASALHALRVRRYPLGNRAFWRAWDRAVAA